VEQLLLRSAAELLSVLWEAAAPLASPTILSSLKSTGCGYNVSTTKMWPLNNA